MNSFLFIPFFLDDVDQEVDICVLFSFKQNQNNMNFLVESILTTIIHFF